MLDPELVSVGDLLASPPGRFDVLTWNIEHHGFTSNAPDGSRRWRRRSAPHKGGYDETERGLAGRMGRVFATIREESPGIESEMPGLMGFNEIGIAAFAKLKACLATTPEYRVFSSVTDVRAAINRNDGRFFAPMRLAGMAGVDSPSRFLPGDDDPDIEDLYGNVVAIDTTVWHIVRHTTVDFPGSRTFRANTALVTRLRHRRIPGPDVVWIHTHLKHADADAEKPAQVSAIVGMVRRARARGLHAIVITGDLYLGPAFLRALTSDLGLAKTHRRKTQRHGGPDDPDQVLIPMAGPLRADGVRLLGSYDRRRELSDHCGVATTLQLSRGPAWCRTEPREVPSRDAPYPREALDAPFKERVRELYLDLFGHSSRDSAWGLA